MLPCDAHHNTWDQWIMDRHSPTRKLSRYQLCDIAIAACMLQIVRALGLLLLPANQSRSTAEEMVSDPRMSDGHRHSHDNVLKLPTDVSLAAINNSESLIRECYCQEFQNFIRVCVVGHLAVDRGTLCLPPTDRASAPSGKYVKTPSPTNHSQKGIKWSNSISSLMAYIWNLSFSGIYSEPFFKPLMLQLFSNYLDK